MYPYCAWVIDGFGPHNFVHQALDVIAIVNAN